MLRSSLVQFGLKRQDSRWATTAEQHLIRMRHQKAVRENPGSSLAFGAGGGSNRTPSALAAREIISGNMQKHYIAALEAEDESGYLIEDVQKRNLAKPPRAVAGAVFGPTPSDGLLPWLATPGEGRKTYVQRSEIAYGRKERWHRVVSDSSMRRQMVDALWSYICDAETETRRLRRDARRSSFVAQQRAQQNAAWLRKMSSVPDRDDRALVDIFCEWPEHPFLKGGASGGGPGKSSSASGDSATALDERPNEEEMTDIEKQHYEEEQAVRTLRRHVKKHGVDHVGLETGSDEVPFAPYEDLPFLRQRFSENPDSLDDSLQSWSKRNLVEQKKLDDREKEAEEKQKAAADSSATQQGGESTAARQKTGSSKSGGGGQEDKRRQRQGPSPLYFSSAKRVAHRHPTFDDEGVYFHVQDVKPRAAVRSLADESGRNAGRGEGGGEEERPFVAANLSAFSDSGYSSEGAAAAAAQHQPGGEQMERQRNILSRSFFKPRMVRAKDNTSRGVVKIDWPTVRAAYGSRSKTDLSREEVAAARERVLRLCRGEDPSGL